MATEEPVFALIAKADYIFGNNKSIRACATRGSEKIAMTAPVSVEPQGNAAGASMPSKRWRVQFTLPFLRRNEILVEIAAT